MSKYIKTYPSGFKVGITITITVTYQSIRNFKKKTLTHKKLKDLSFNSSRVIWVEATESGTPSSNNKEEHPVFKQIGVVGKNVFIVGGSAAGAILLSRFFNMQQNTTPLVIPDKLIMVEESRCFPLKNSTKSYQNFDREEISSLNLENRGLEANFYNKCNTALFKRFILYKKYNTALLKIVLLYKEYALAFIRIDTNSILIEPSASTTQMSIKNKGRFSNLPFATITQRMGQGLQSNAAQESRSIQSRLSLVAPNTLPIASQEILEDRPQPLTTTISVLQEAPPVKKKPGVEAGLAKEIKAKWIRKSMAFSRDLFSKVKQKFKDLRSPSISPSWKTMLETNMRKGPPREIETAPPSSCVATNLINSQTSSTNLINSQNEITNFGEGPDTIAGQGKASLAQMVSDNAITGDLTKLQRRGQARSPGSTAQSTSPERVQSANPIWPKLAPSSSYKELPIETAISDKISSVFTKWLNNRAKVNLNSNIVKEKGSEAQIKILNNLNKRKENILNKRDVALKNNIERLESFNLSIKNKAALAEIKAMQSLEKIALEVNKGGPNLANNQQKQERLTLGLAKKKEATLLKNKRERQNLLSKKKVSDESAQESYLSADKLNDQALTNILIKIDDFHAKKVNKFREFTKLQVALDRNTFGDDYVDYLQYDDTTNLVQFVDMGINFDFALFDLAKSTTDYNWKVHPNPNMVESGELLNRARAFKNSNNIIQEEEVTRKALVLCDSNNIIQGSFAYQEKLQNEVLATPDNFDIPLPVGMKLPGYIFDKVGYNQAGRTKFKNGPGVFVLDCADAGVTYVGTSEFRVSEVNRILGGTTINLPNKVRDALDLHKRAGFTVHFLRCGGDMTNLSNRLLVEAGLILRLEDRAANVQKSLFNVKRHNNLVNPITIGDPSPQKINELNRLYGKAFKLFPDNLVLNPDKPTATIYQIFIPTGNAGEYHSYIGRTSGTKENRCTEHKTRVGYFSTLLDEGKALTKQCDSDYAMDIARIRAKSDIDAYLIVALETNVPEEHAYDREIILRSEGGVAYGEFMLNPVSKRRKKKLPFQTPFLG